MLSIKTKIVFAYTAVFGILLVGFALIVYERVRDSEFSELDARLEAHADKLQTELEENSGEPGFPNTAELGSVRTEGLVTVRIRLLTADKDVVFSDSGFVLGTRMEWNAGGATGLYKATMTMGGHRMRVLQGPVEIDDRIPYVIQVAAPTERIEADLARLRMLLMIAIPVALLLAGCAAWFISVMAFRPMMRMVRTARTISVRNLDARLELPKAGDEVHKFGSALNEMMERIDGAVRSQRQFVADASHELRTPLTIIRTELESAAQRIRGTRSKRSIATALAEVDHLSSMVTGLLMLARLDAAQMPFEAGLLRLDELLIECVQAVRGIARRQGVRVKIFIEEAVEARGDAAKLTSVILNLLDNAIKYSGRRGTVSASLVLDRAPAGTVSIVIRDSGPGISPSDLANIFNRFYRGSQSRVDSGEGSGLGLAIAQRFVEMHGGRISAQSEGGHGSIFTVTLPLQPANLSYSPHPRS
jgi:two-component system OmpR family sensor kinase